MKSAAYTLSFIASILFFASCQPAPKMHLFILSGQSNMQGLDPEISFVPTVAERYGAENVIVVHDALGGQPIRRWDKSWKATGEQNPDQIGDLYDQLMSKVATAIEGQSLASVSFLWMQGERDAREALSDLYTDSFKRVVGQLEKDLSRDDINVVYGRLSDFDLSNKTYPHWTRMRELQVALAESEPRMSWVDTDDLNDGVNKRGATIKDDLHYSVSGYKEFGSRLANAAIALIDE